MTITLAVSAALGTAVAFFLAAALLSVHGAQRRYRVDSRRRTENDRRRFAREIRESSEVRSSCSSSESRPPQTLR
jgi:hypothetical protein